MNSLEEFAEKLEENNELGKLAKTIDSNTMDLRLILKKNGLNNQLSDLNEAIKYYKSAPTQTQLDVEIIAKCCLNKGYRELSEKLNILAERIGDYSRNKY